MALTRNLRTLEERTYSCSPRDAVMAAHAQSRGDWNTWEYEERYSCLTVETRLTFLCGDWATFKDGREG